MGLLSNKIQREQLKPGDHIYTWRNGYSYSHHGIYVGDGKVIHLTRAPGLIIFSSSKESFPFHQSPGQDRVDCCGIEDFLSGGDLNLYHYGVNGALFLIKRGGTCTRTSSDPPEDVLRRAYSLEAKGFGHYNLLHRNCEDFAIYCKTGLLKVDMYRPGGSGQIKFLYSIFLAVTITPYQFLPASFIFLALVVCGLYCGFIFTNDSGVEKVAVEKFDLCSHRSVKMENDSTRRSMPLWEFIGYTIWVVRYWSWAPTSGILIWIRSVALFVISYAFVSYQLSNHPMNLKLGECVAWIIWVLGYWYCSSESRIYFWTKLMCLYCFLRLFITDPLRCSKLKDYISHTAWLLGLWYWNPESTLLLWIRLVFLHLLLFNLFSITLFNNRFKFGRFFFACFVIQSAALFLGLDYIGYFLSITKSIFLQLVCIPLYDC